MTTKLREHWIDNLKAICIICVYIAHCESFYLHGSNIATFIVTPFYVNAFFFISGYLLIKKYFKENHIKNYSIKREYKNDLKNVLFRITIPTIIFSAIIYIPKHSGIFDLNSFIYKVLGGISLWFTSALCISQLIIYTLLLSRRTNIWFYTVITFVIFLLTTFLGNVKSKSAMEYFPWFWQTGFIYTFLMLLGGVYYKHENKINKFLNNVTTIIVMLICYSTILYFVWNGTKMYCLGLSGKSNILGYIVTILSILILIYFSKLFSSNKVTQFIGKQSIVFYFLSGAIPSTIKPLINKIPLENSYIVLISYILLSLTISYIATHIIVRYFPFLLDLRNRKKQK